MKTFAITPTLIALALVGVLSACGKSNTASTPPATSSSTTTIVPAPTNPSPATSPSTPPASGTMSPSTSLDTGGKLARSALPGYAQQPASS